jgi:hypothetical protein
MSEGVRVERRRQFCARCGQLMFEYFRSPDGHFGLVGRPVGDEAGRSGEVCCPICGARYRLLDKLSLTGQPVERQ